MLFEKEAHLTSRDDDQMIRDKVDEALGAVEALMHDDPLPSTSESSSPVSAKTSPDFGDHNPLTTSDANSRCSSLPNPFRIMNVGKVGPRTVA